MRTNSPVTRDAKTEETGFGATLHAGAARAADFVVLALPGAAAKDAKVALGDRAGKTIIDCMSPLGMVDGAQGLTIG